MENYALRGVYGEGERAGNGVVDVYKIYFETPPLQMFAGGDGYFPYVVQAVFAQFVVDEGERQARTRDGNVHFL